MSPLFSENCSFCSSVSGNKALDDKLQVHIRRYKEKEERPQSIELVDGQVMLAAFEHSSPYWRAVFVHKHKGSRAGFWLRKQPKDKSIRISHSTSPSTGKTFLNIYMKKCHWEILWLPITTLFHFSVVFFILIQQTVPEHKWLSQIYERTSPLILVGVSSVSTKQSLTPWRSFAGF